MKYKELTTKSEAEVRNMLEELRTGLHDMKVKSRLGQIKTTHKLKEAKKDIARMMIYLHSKNK